MKLMQWFSILDHCTFDCGFNQLSAQGVKYRPLTINILNYLTESSSGSPER